MVSITSKMGIVLLFSLTFLGTDLYPQPEDKLPKTPKEAVFYIQFNTGFNTFNLSDVKNFYDEILQLYRSHDIPIPTQRKYPGNLLLGIEAIFNDPSKVNLGIAATYTWTRAFSLYEDYAGELDVNSRVRLLAIQGVFGKDLRRESKFYPFIEARGGVVFSHLEYEEEIRFTDIPELNSTSLLSANGSGLDIEGYVGVKYSMNRFLVSIMTGYRYAKISEPEGELKINNQLESLGKIPLDINLSGLVVMITIGTHF